MYSARYHTLGYIVEHCGGEPEQADTEVFSLSDVIVLYPGPAQLCIDGKLDRGAGNEATM